MDEITNDLYILIADRFLLQTGFDENGYTNGLKFVENGAELMYHLNQISEQKLLTDFSKIILLDLNMPKKDGSEALKELKESIIFKKILVIVFTTTKISMK